MKKVLLTTLIALSVGSVYAQPDADGVRGERHGLKHRGDPVAHLTEKLNLSEDQAAQVSAILEESRAMHKEIQGTVQEEHCAVRENTLSELAAVLDDEQLAHFEDMQSRRAMRGRHHGMPRFANCEA
jgi:hypothetical protein